MAVGIFSVQDVDQGVAGPVAEVLVLRNPDKHAGLVLGLHAGQGVDESSRLDGNRRRSCGWRDGDLLGSLVLAT